MKQNIFSYTKYIILLALIGLCASCKTVTSPPVLPEQEAPVPENDSLEESTITPGGEVEDRAPPGIPIIQVES